MIKRIFKENRFFNFLRITALVEAVFIIILSVIAFSTKNAFLFRVLLYVGGITALFAMSLLFLKFLHIIDSNPIGDISSALLILAIFITLISGIPAVDSLNKSIETLKDLPNFMETQTEIMNKAVVVLEDLPDFIQAQTEAMNKSIETLEGLPDFMETQTEVMDKSVVILEEIHDFLLKP